MVNAFPNGKFGMHSHNDSGCAVANSLISSENLVQIQGTINGFGERTGNADLCQIIPALVLKKKVNLSFDLNKVKYVSDMWYHLYHKRPCAQPDYDENQHQVNQELFKKLQANQV